ncbi:bacterioferritin [Thiohalobacter thiocyanaticus]|uniref:Bacterioferritin n=1 Tax=Thiohalobacter thiocyanaticus TaxID=585455 RepID=A0A1Z4VND1_9GAMM|nr:bacterioferritin [Thiohalobacter thiocyanaticus]
MTMAYASADQRVLGYLGRALSLELSAVQLYSTQARLTATWGLTEAAERLRTEAREEMGHVERIIARLLALGAAPNASQLRPVRLGANLEALLQEDQSFEQELVQLYTEAAGHCALQGDHDSRLFFTTLLEEEREHARELAAWIEELKRPAATSGS